MTKPVIKKIATPIQQMAMPPKWGPIQQLAMAAQWELRYRTLMGKKLIEQKEMLKIKCEQIDIIPTDDNILALINNRFGRGAGTTIHDVAYYYLGEAFYFNFLAWEIYLKNKNFIGGEFEKADGYVDKANEWSELFVQMATFLKLQPDVAQGRKSVKEKKIKKEYFNNTVRKKGVEAIKEKARPVHDAIAKINADLLSKPANEGWKVDVRAKYIAGKVNRSESYVRRLIATPRKTNQT